MPERLPYSGITQVAQKIISDRGDDHIVMGPAKQDQESDHTWYFMVATCDKEKVIRIDQIAAATHESALLTRQEFVNALDEMEIPFIIHAVEDSEVFMLKLCMELWPGERATELYTKVKEEYDGIGISEENLNAVLQCTSERLKMLTEFGDGSTIDVIRFGRIAAAWHEDFNHWVIIDVEERKIICVDMLQFHYAENAAGFMVAIKDVIDRWMELVDVPSNDKELDMILREAAIKNRVCGSVAANWPIWTGDGGVTTGRKRSLH